MSGNMAQANYEMCIASHTTKVSLRGIGRYIRSTPPMTYNFPFLAVVRREMLTNMRRKRTFAFLALLVFIAIVVVTANWPRANMAIYQISSRTARDMLTFFILTLLGAVGLFVPALASSAFVSEKERDTYDMLILTLARPSGLITAKMLSTGGLIILMLLATMPVMGTVFFLVGLDPGQVIGPFLVILASTVSCAMISIYCSAKFRKTIPATIASYLSIAFLMGGWYLLLLPGITFRWYHISDNGLMMSITCPFVLCVNGVTGGLGFIHMPTLYALGCAYHAILALIAFRLTLRILRRPLIPPKTQKAKPIDDAATLAARRKRFPYYLIDPLRRKKPIEDGRNPMLIKELRWGMAQRGTVMVRVFYIALVVSTCIVVTIIFETAWQSISRRAMLNPSVVFIFLVEIAVIMAVAPVFLSSALTKEYELGNIDMLRMTLIGPFSIILGKIMAGLFSLLPILTACTISSLLSFIAFKINGATILAYFCGFITLGVNILVILSISLFASVMAKRTSTALVTSYVLGLLVTLGTTFSIVLFFELFDIRHSQQLERFALALSPILSFASFMDSYRHQGMAFAFWIASMSTYTLASLLLLLYSGARFAMRRL